jgi:hypothetical protein
VISSCEHQIPAYRFSNFESSEISNLALAVKNNDIKAIRYEVLDEKAKINLTDGKYYKSLLALAIANDKKEAFKELLKLGANPNYYSVNNCFSPMITAIRLNENCDLFFIKELLKYDVNLNPGFFKICNIGHYDPLLDTIMFFNGNEQCCIDILDLLITKLGEIDLNDYNDDENYMQNIVYFCLSTRNLNALKYLIIDLQYKVPSKIFINGTVLSGLYDVEAYSLKEILSNKNFTFNKDLKYIEKQRKEILDYLNKN